MMTNEERPLRSHCHSAVRTLTGSSHALAAVRTMCLAVFGPLFIAGCGDNSNSGPDSGSADDAATSATADATSGDASRGVDAGDDSAGGGQDTGGGGSDSSGDSPSGSPDTGGDVVNESATGTDSGGSTSGLHVQGNSIVDNGHAIRLLGVNISGTETYCEQGLGIFQAPTVNSNVDPAVVSAMQTWKIKAVRVPLNEDCWLGINGVQTQYGGANYSSAIAGFVKQLRTAGMYVVVDLHWNAPGTTLANSQQPMADADHSVAFWTSVAQTFKSDMGVLFDLYNEPNIDGGNVTAASWDCWLNGCAVSNWSGFQGAASTAGMQQMVDAVRGAGAANLIMVGGLGDAEFVDANWLSHKPVDPRNNLAASHHNYNFNGGCNTQACWMSKLGLVAAQVPIVVSELGESDCAHGYVDSFFAWADPLGVSYMGWTWNNWNCGSGPALVTDFYGTPTVTYGQGFKAHLLTQ